MLRPAGKHNRPHRRRCGVVTARENLTVSLDLTVSQCDCAHIWTAGTVKSTNRGAEEIQHHRPNNPGQRGRINHAKLWSERLETKERGACRQFQTRQGLGGRAVTWQGTAQPKTKRNAQISCQALREESDNPRGGTQLCRYGGTKKFLRNIERSTRERPNQVLQGQDKVKGRLRARNQRLIHLATMVENRENHERRGIRAQ